MRRRVYIVKPAVSPWLCGYGLATQWQMRAQNMLQAGPVPPGLLVPNGSARRTCLGRTCATTRNLSKHVLQAGIWQSTKWLADDRHLQNKTHGSAEEKERKKGEQEWRGEPRRDAQDKEEGDPDGDRDDEQQEHDEARTEL